MAAALSAAGLLATTVSVAAAAPAQAVGRCVERPHAYLIHGGRAYFNAYDGVQFAPVPQLVVDRGERVELGGNGIDPTGGAITGTIAFTVSRFPSLGQPGGPFNFGPIPGQAVYRTQRARDNCVVHQEGPYRITAPPGKYRIQADYRGSLGLVRVNVVDVEVLPGPPPIGLGSAAAGDATTASSDADLVGSMPSGIDPGGGTEPDPCNPLLPCTV
jgi:hypothetical protein